jgi:hypothetical protein
VESFDSRIRGAAAGPTLALANGNKRRDEVADAILSVVERCRPSFRKGWAGSAFIEIMGLLGCYSNPEIQGRLRRLSEKLERLAASNAAPRPSGRQDQRLRGGLVPKAIQRVLHEAPGPMRARDIHAEVEELLGRSVPASSVKNWLAKQAQYRQSQVVRLDSGGIGWPNALLIPGVAPAARSRERLSGAAHCGRLGARSLGERWLAVAM